MRLSNIYDKYYFNFSFFRPEYSLFVGELSDDVDDYVLYQAFAKRYRSCRSVKSKFVVMDVL